MSKYNVGECLADKHCSVAYYKILMIAPVIDIDERQCYFVEYRDEGEVTYLCCDDKHLDEFAER